MPCGLVGSERVRDWKRLKFPKATVQFGDPIRFERVEAPDREQSQAASEEIFARIETLWSGIRENGRTATVRARRAARRARRQATAS